MHRYRTGRDSANRAGLLAGGTGLALAVTLTLAVAGCAGPPNVTTPPSTSDTAAPSSAAEAAPPESPGQAGTGGGATAPPQQAGPGPCRSSTLRVSLGSGDAAAGTSYVQLEFTNTGARPCVIQGFAGVSYVTGDHGTQVGAAAERDGAKGGPVTLAPKAVASATLARVQVLNYDESVCRPTPVRGLRVYPPGDTVSVFVPTDGTGCAGNPPGPQLRISTVKSGPGRN